MSLQATLARIAQIDSTFAPPAAPVAITGGTAAPAADASSPSVTAADPTATAASVSPTSFASTLQQVMAPPATPGVDANGNSAIVAAAQTQVGQTEQPPGSNDSPAIAQYRASTLGAVAGAPWCAYFASWAAQQAGTPIGANGQGLGSVAQIWSWAQQTGRAVQNGPGVVPKPGDLIVFGDEHVGIVKSVLPDGDIQTIEGNYDNQVAQNVRAPGEATGYVSMS